MTGTSVLPPASEPDRLLDMPLHHKPKPANGSTTETMGGLHMIKEHDEEAEQDHAAVRNRYETMTYSDLSSRMAENYKELSAMLNNMGTSISDLTPTEKDPPDFPVACDEEEEDDDQLIHRSGMDDSIKRAKMTKLFCRAASSGDLDKVTQWLNGPHRAYIDIDAKDEDGTTPLIYAACFNKADIAQALLEAGAKTDVQDSYGWSALMWATNNNNESIVKLLLESGASSQTKSAKGRTVFDFLNTDNQKIVEILATNPRDSFSSTSSLMGRNNGSVSSSSSNAGDYDFYYQSTMEGYDSFMTEEADRRRKLLETAIALADGQSCGSDDENAASYDDDFAGRGNDPSDDEDCEMGDSTIEFLWDRCLPDQMFVFSADNLNYILDTVITNIQLPVRSRQEICIPANVVFLSARFAHYFSSDELLQDVMTGAMDRISTEIKTNARNVHILSFWITNATQLLYYLKKDAGLVVPTAEHQLQISELISEIYTMIVSDTERRLAKILTPAMINHELIPGMDDVNFADDWQRFFRRSTRRSVMVPPDGGLAVQMKRSSSTQSTSKEAPAPAPAPASASTAKASNAAAATTTTSSHNTFIISPQSVTSLLTSTLYVLQSYDVHPTIIIQALAQFFHYMSCEMFNRILSNKKMLCRSKAVQIRMNISQIEDWVCEQHLPSSLVSYFDPTTQLLQLLQCLTQLHDLVSFIHTVKKFDALNALQVKRCVTNYRYEVNEQRLPEEIEKYAMQLAEDTIRYKQARSLEIVRRKSTSMARTQSVSMRRSRSRRDSVSSFVGSLMSSVGLSNSASLPPTIPSTPTEEKEELEVAVSETAISSSTTIDEPDRLDEEEVKETRDSKFMLPFSVPTTAHMVSINGWAPESTKNEERLVVPVIPEEWMDRLDDANRPLE